MQVAASVSKDGGIGYNFLEAQEIVKPGFFKEVWVN